MGAGLRRSFIGGGAGLRRSKTGGKKTRKSTRRVKKSKTSRRSKTRRMKKKGGLKLPNFVKSVGGLKPSELKMGDCVKGKYGEATYVVAVKGKTTLTEALQPQEDAMCAPNQLSCEICNGKVNALQRSGCFDVLPNFGCSNFQQLFLC